MSASCFSANSLGNAQAAKLSSTVNPRADSTTPKRSIFYLLYHEVLFGITGMRRRGQRTPWKCRFPFKYFPRDGAEPVGRRIYYYTIEPNRQGRHEKKRASIPGLPENGKDLFLIVTYLGLSGFGIIMKFAYLLV